MSDTALLSHPFRQLGDALPSIVFDPAVDIDCSKVHAIADYLRFYHLDFTAIDGGGVQHRMGNFNAAGYRIAAHYWHHPQAVATVFVIHGYYDHVGLFAHIIRWCLQHGYSVVAFDLPGHGLSSGAPASIGSFAEYVSVLQQCIQQCTAHFATQWFALGQSTGSAILLKLMLEQPQHYPFVKTVLLAPLIRPWHWSRRKWKYSFFGRLLGRWVTSRPREYALNSSDPAFSEFILHQDPLQCHRLPVAWVGAMKAWADSFASLPVSANAPLVIQGTADMSVDWESNLEQLRHKLPHAQVQLLPTAAHHLVNEAPALREKWIALVGKYFDNQPLNIV